MPAAATFWVLTSSWCWGRWIMRADRRVDRRSGGRGRLTHRHRRTASSAKSSSEIGPLLRPREPELQSVLRPWNPRPDRRRTTSRGSPGRCPDAAGCREGPGRTRQCSRRLRTLGDQACGHAIGAEGQRHLDPAERLGRKRDPRGRLAAMLAEVHERLDRGRPRTVRGGRHRRAANAGASGEAAGAGAVAGAVGAGVATGASAAGAADAATGAGVPASGVA